MLNVVYERYVCTVPPANTYIYYKDLVSEGGAVTLDFFRGDSNQTSMALYVVRQANVAG